MLVGRGVSLDRLGTFCRSHKAVTLSNGVPRTVRPTLAYDFGGTTLVPDGFIDCHATIRQVPPSLRHTDIKRSLISDHVGPSFFRISCPPANTKSGGVLRKIAAITS